MLPLNFAQRITQSCQEVVVGCYDRAVHREFDHRLRFADGVDLCLCFEGGQARTADLFPIGYVAYDLAGGVCDDVDVGFQYELIELDVCFSRKVCGIRENPFDGFRIGMEVVDRHAQHVVDVDIESFLDDRSYALEGRHGLLVDEHELAVGIRHEDIGPHGVHRILERCQIVRQACCARARAAV